MSCKTVIFEAIHDDGIKLLKQSGKVDLKLGLSRDEQLEIIANYDAVIVRSVTDVDAEFIHAAASLKAIGRAGTGTENIDMEAAKDRNITVLTVPTGNSVSAAEFTIALMFCLNRHLPRALDMVSEGDYRRHLVEGREFTNLNVGLVGLGNVGKNVATRLRPFGCKLFGIDPHPLDEEGFLSIGGTMLNSLAEMISKVDILSFHVRVTDDTSGMLDAECLAQAKRGLMLVNTSRAHVIDDIALLEALNKGIVSSAALDVLSPEPPFDADPCGQSYSHPLLDHPNVVVTPHMAASTADAQLNIALDLASQLNDFLVS
jgi:D-3-phosphoglycerate dehydrogenase / 2-oxoglutarate reductase